MNLLKKLKERFQLSSAKELNGVKLALSSFPVLLNYDKEVQKEYKRKIDDVLTTHDPKAIFQLGADVMSLAKNLYIATTPEAVISRRNAFKLIEDAANCGYEPAQVMMCISLMSGIGTQQNIAKAVKTLEELVDGSYDKMIKKASKEALNKLKKDDYIVEPSSVSSTVHETDTRTGVIRTIKTTYPMS